MNLNNITQIVVRVLLDANRKEEAVRVFRLNHQPKHHFGYYSDNPIEMEQ
jgi:hypothetical protein